MKKLNLSPSRSISPSTRECLRRSTLLYHRHRFLWPSHLAQPSMAGSVLGGQSCYHSHRNRFSRALTECPALLPFKAPASPSHSVHPDMSCVGSLARTPSTFSPSHPTLPSMLCTASLLSSFIVITSNN